MAKVWLKLWTVARNDAKLRSLSDAVFRAWFKLLCFATEQMVDGEIDLPSRIVAVEVFDGDIEAMKRACNELNSVTTRYMRF